MPGQYANAAGQGVAYQAAAYAFQLLGIPYVWGGSSLSGVDCSGLVDLVYEKFGVQLPRTSQQQATVGTAVAPNALQPGDIVFYNEPGEGANSHEALYVGNGRQIEAAHSGTDVSVTNVDWAHFAGARRVASGGASGGPLPNAQSTALGTAQASQTSWWNPLTWGGSVTDLVKTLAVSLPIVLGAVAILVVGAWKTFDLPKPNAVPVPVPV